MPVISRPAFSVNPGQPSIGSDVALRRYTHRILQAATGENSSVMT